jgi:hypothetical protein
MLWFPLLLIMVILCALFRHARKPADGSSIALADLFCYTNELFTCDSPDCNELVIIPGCDIFSHTLLSPFTKALPLTRKLAPPLAALFRYSACPLYITESLTSRVQAISTISPSFRGVSALWSFER